MNSQLNNCLICLIACVWLEITAPALLQAQEAPPANTDPQPVNVRYPGVITGRVVVESTGEPVVGVQVRAGSSGDVRREALTDATGAYVLRNVRSGSYRVEVSEPDDYVPLKSTEVRVLRNEVTAEQLTLPAAQWVSGYVLEYGTGKAMENIDIEARLADGTVRTLNTGDQGRYWLFLNPQTVELSCPGKDGDYFASGPDGTRLPAGASTQVVLGPGQHLTRRDLVISHTPHFRGQVLMPDGSPAADAQVRLWVWFHIPRPGRDQAWQFQRSGEFDIVRGMAPLDFSSGSLGPGGMEYNGRSTAQGEFTGSIIQYQKLVVGRETCIPFVSDVVAWSADRTLVGLAAKDGMTIRLARPGSVRFQLVDLQGKPLSEAPLVLGSSADGGTEYGVAPLESLGEGKYRAVGLIPGFHYHLHHLHGDSLQRHPYRQFAVQAGEELDLGVLSPRPFRDLEELVWHLALPDYDIRQSALEELAARGSSDPDVVSLLTAALDAPYPPYVWGDAAEVLGKLGPAAAAAVPRLIELVREEPKGHPVHASITALGRIGDRRGLLALKEKLAIPQFHNEEQALTALSSFPAEDVVPVLTRMLAMSKVRHREICEHLAKIGPPAREAVPALLALVELGPRRNHFAISALARIGDPRALPVLERVASEATDGHDFSVAAGAIDDILAQATEVAKAIDEIPARRQQSAPAEK